MTTDSGLSACGQVQLLTVMDAFFGTWRLVPDGNSGVEALGQASGWPAEQIEAVKKQEMKWILEEFEDQYKMVMDYGVAQKEIIFQAGVELDYAGLDGVKAKGVIEMRGGKLTEDFTNEDGSTFHVESHLEGDNAMITKTTFSKYPGVEMVTVFVKEQTTV